LVVTTRQKFSAQKLSNGVFYVKIIAKGVEKTLKLVVGK
jgi:hypothetical protein